jgi:hypothetical protein
VGLLPLSHYSRKEKAMAIKSWDKCKNCGGDYGIHHWETNQCPFGGVEAGPNRPDRYTDSRFELDQEDEYEALKSRIDGLEKQVAALLAAVPSAKVEK